MNNDEIFKSVSVRRMVDTVSYLILLLIGMAIRKISNIVGWTLIVWATFFFIWIQTNHHVERYDGELVITNSSIFGPIDVTHQNLSLIPFFLSGIIHVVSLVDRSHKYELARLISQGHLIRTSRKVVIRGLDIKTPQKQIVLSQHVPGISDIFSVMMFSGENEISVIQDLGSSVQAKFASKILAPIYGGVNIDRTQPEILKRSIDTLAETMKMSSCGSYIIWPSGAIWKNSLKNGIVSFRSGAFYLSIYSQIPVCFVHVRGDISKIIVERTGYFYPPAPDHLERNVTYDEFSRCPRVKEMVNEFRNRVEGIYRDLDDKMVGELSI